MSPDENKDEPVTAPTEATDVAAYHAELAALRAEREALRDE